MRPLFFICGVARITVPAVFTTIAFAAPATGVLLAGPFGLLVASVAIYDARERHRRRQR